LLSRARKRRFAARSVTSIAGIVLVAAPTVAAAAVHGSVPPVPLPPVPAGEQPPAVGSAVNAVASAGGCRGAGARSGRAVMRRALLCLINQQRARSGRHALAADRRLARAAGRHASDMSRRHYFGHVSPGGTSPRGRARAAGWRGGVGEIIAWGCGRLSTPRATVRAWMASPPHRAIMLGGAHVVGIGVKRAPGCGGRAYWVADLG
jgi:uncharacterized protein YkwD